MSTLPVHLFGDRAHVFDGSYDPHARAVPGVDELRRLLTRDDAIIVAEAGPLAAAARDLDEAMARRWAGVIVVGDAAGEKAAFEAFESVTTVLRAPLSKVAWERAVQEVRDHTARVNSLERLRAQLAHRNAELSTLNKIGAALSAERDIHRLLSLILDKSRAITTADAGSLYLVERGEGGAKPEAMRFVLARNDSVSVPFAESRMPLSDASIAGHVAIRGRAVNIADAYELPEGTPYRISRSFDEKSGYRTKSMLVVPMRDHEDQVIGVIQLINKKRNGADMLSSPQIVEQLVIPFDGLDLDLMSSLASQAAVALTNTRLVEDIRNLFNSFVDASVTAIESRDPTTSGHSGRVAELTVGLMKRVDEVPNGPFADVKYSADQLQEVRYASLLHDFGKVGVREKVLVKAKKLFFGELLAVRQRFGLIKRTIEVECLRAQMDAMKRGAGEDEIRRLAADLADRHRSLDGMLDVVLKSNEPTVLDGDSAQALLEMPKRTYVDVDGVARPYLTPNEVQALSIRRGSLSEEERREIESHVTHTYRFLAQIPWTGQFAGIPEIAYAHHEKLDGSGYPRKLRGDSIPIQSRMMAISDIFDALVAWDRPYKKAVPTEKALSILHDEAGQGKLDQDLLKIFVDARVFELTARK